MKGDAGKVKTVDPEKNGVDLPGYASVGLEDGDAGGIFDARDAQVVVDREQPGADNLRIRLFVGHAGAAHLRRGNSLLEAVVGADLVLDAVGEPLVEAESHRGVKGAEAETDHCQKEAARVVPALAVQLGEAHVGDERAQPVSEAVHRPHQQREEMGQHEG